MLETLSVYFPCNEITIDNIGFRTELARPSSGLRPPSLCGEGLPFSFSWSCLRANATAGKPRETTGNSSLRAKRGNPSVSSSLRAKRGNLPVSSSLRAKRGNLPVSSSLRAKRGKTAWKTVIASAARQPGCQFVIASEARQSACQFVIARCAATQRYPKGHYVRLLVRHPERSEGSYPQKTGRLPRPRSSYQGRGHSSGGGSQ